MGANGGFGRVFLLGGGATPRLERVVLWRSAEGVRPGGLLRCTDVVRWWGWVRVEDR